MAVDRPPDKQSPAVGLLVPPEPGLQAAAPRVLLAAERGLYVVTSVHADKHVGLVKNVLVVEDVLAGTRALLVEGDLFKR